MTRPILSALVLAATLVSPAHARMPHDRIASIVCTVKSADIQVKSETETTARRPRADGIKPGQGILPTLAHMDTTSAEAPDTFGVLVSGIRDAKAYGSAQFSATEVATDGTTLSAKAADGHLTLSSTELSYAVTDADTGATTMSLERSTPHAFEGHLTHVSQSAQQQTEIYRLKCQNAEERLPLAIDWAQHWTAAPWG